MREKLNLRLLGALFLEVFASLTAMAQDISVRGHVKDGLGEPVMGASVVETGTTNGISTDMDGNFTLRVKQGATLRVSFIGYVAQEVAATPSMVITLVEDSELLDDVVVIGYGVARKNDMTGSVTAIKPDALNKGFVTNPQEMLSGKVAGVNITSAGGAPGAGATIRIRGGSSWAANDPLIVIDGLAMDNNGVKGLSNPLAMVNPADIETFTVLKDASATAIYGSRGSNGVIIITTKKGVADKRPHVAYNGSVSVSQKKKTVDVMDGNEFRTWVSGLAGIDPDAIAALGTENTDWQDEIYRTAVSQDHNITVSGGTKYAPFRASLGYTGQEGIVKTSDFDRYTLSFNISPNLLDEHLKINVTSKAMVAYTDYANTDAISAAVWMDPTQPIRSADPRYDNFGGYFQWLSDGSALGDPTWPYTTNGNATKNPVAMLEQYDKHASSTAFIGNVEVDYKIHGFEDLHLHMNAGGDFSSGKEYTTIPQNSGTSTYFGWDGWEKIDKRNLSFNAYAQYLKDINKANHFDIMAGYEWQKFHRETHNVGSGFYPLTNSNNPGEAYNVTDDIYATENYLVSFFGRANYSLLDRYLLTATVRYDGSSRFKDHWALFPSFALGWKFKEEAFLRDVDWWSEGKLRLGYGQTGQQDGVGDYYYYALYSVSSIAKDGQGSAYPIVGDGTLYRPTVYNEDLTWETTTTYNVGIDLGWIDNRITFSADAYYRETTDLINTAYVAAGSNFRNQVTRNIGSLENKGFELSLTLKPVQTKDWYWEVTANATYNKNEITKLIGNGDNYYVATGGISSGTGNTIQAHAVGHPASSFYVYQQVYGEDGLPIEGAYVDRNADGIINQDDLYFYKSPNAPWTFGLSSKVTWKRWDLGFGARASLGNYVFNDLEAGSSNVSASNMWQYKYLPNHPKSVIPKNWQTYDNPLSDYFVHNASFIKLDNITLGYSFPRVGRVPLSGRIYGSVNNVLTITEYDGIDPEVFGGIDNNMYPRPFTAQLGLSLNF